MIFQIYIILAIPYDEYEYNQYQVSWSRKYYQQTVLTQLRVDSFLHLVTFKLFLSNKYPMTIYIIRNAFQ